MGVMSDMKYKDYRKKIMIGMIFVAIAGTAAHFVYDFTGQNNFVGLFCPINESTWEHMKLAFFPMLIFTLIYNVTSEEDNKCVNLAPMTGTLVATWAIPFLFYTYQGILGFSKMWLDISTYYVSRIIAIFMMLHIIKRVGQMKCKICAAVSKILLLLQGIAFVVFTYKPLDLGIFK